MKENEWQCPRCGELLDVVLWQCPRCGVFRNEEEKKKCFKTAYLILLFENRRLLEKSEIIVEMELLGYSAEEIEAGLDWLMDNKYLYWFGKKGSLLLSKRGEDSLSEFKRLREKRLL